MGKYTADMALPNAPNRCQAVTSHGQCNLTAVEGSSYCKYHGGNSVVRSQQKESTRRLLVERWQNDIDDFAFSTNIKSLRDEIGVLRLILEQKLNMCTDQLQLVLQAGPITSLINTITKTIEACDKIDTKLDNTMDKSQVVEFAGKIVNIVATVLGDDTRVAKISDAIIAALKADA